MADTKEQNNETGEVKTGKLDSDMNSGRIKRIFRAIGKWFVTFFSAIGRWFVRAGKVVSKVTGKISKAWDQKVSPKVKKYVSPVFVTILILCFLLWYFLKLGEDYTSARVPVKIDIEGRDVRLNVYATGRGAKLLNMRYSNHKDLTFNWGDLEVTPDPNNPRVVIISPNAIQSKISQRYPELEITSLQIPGIEL